MTSTSVRTLLSASLIAVATACAPGPVPHQAREAARPPAAPAAPPRAQPVEAEPVDDPPAGAEPQAIPEVILDEQGCVRDPRAHAAQLVLDHHAASVAERLGRAPVLADVKGPVGCLSVSSLPDLDGDGTDETEVMEACSWGTHAALHLLYFSNKGCPRFAGEVIDGPLTPQATRGAGVRDLESTWSNGCAGLDFAWTRRRWDGHAYRVIDRASCYFCDDPTISSRPPRANAHPYCKAQAKSRGTSARSTR